MKGHDGPSARGLQELPVVDSGMMARANRRPALVLDLSGHQVLGVLDLSLLLTAQQHAKEEDRDVWLAGVPYHLWRELHEMGLGGNFKPFPTSPRLVV